MLINELMEQQNLVSSSTARDIGTQLYNVAKQKAYEAGKPNDANNIANKLANRFYSTILMAIEDETRFQTAKSIK